MTFQVGDLVEFEANGAREAGVVFGKAPAGGLEIRGSFGVTHVLPMDTLRVVGREFAGRLGPARVRGLLRSILTVQLQRHIRNHKREKAYPPWGYDWNGDNYGDKKEGFVTWTPGEWTPEMEIAKARYEKRGKTLAQNFVQTRKYLMAQEEYLRQLQSLADRRRPGTSKGNGSGSWSGLEP